MITVSAVTYSVEKMSKVRLVTIKEVCTNRINQSYEIIINTIHFLHC